MLYSIRGLVEILGHDALKVYCHHGCLGKPSIDAVKVATSIQPGTDGQEEPEDADSEDTAEESENEDEGREDESGGLHSTVGSLFAKWRIGIMVKSLSKLVLLTLGWMIRKTTRR